MNGMTKIELENWLTPIIIDLFKTKILRTFRTSISSLEVYSEGYLLGRTFTIIDEFIEDEEKASTFELPESEKNRIIESCYFTFGNRKNEEFNKQAYVDPSLKYDGDPLVFVNFLNGFIDGREFTKNEIGMEDDNQIGDDKFYEFVNRFGIVF